MKFKNTFLKELFEQKPELFLNKTIIEDNTFLAEYGIFIPEKENLPFGYIKLHTEDFIVEEIDKNGKIQTIDYENILTENTIIAGTGNTIYATLVKCGLSTLEVINDISRQININPKDIGYAGIKDKNAITSQRISFRNIDNEQIKNIKSNNYFLKDVMRDKGVIEMSHLKGNKFTIFIRTDNQNTLSEIQRNEFIFANYFYLQRFGTPRLISHELGYHLLKGDYEKTIKEILFRESPYEMEALTECRREASKHTTLPDIKKIIEPYEEIMSQEVLLLNYLCKNPQDFIGALKLIPEQVQLWIYALNSFCFNHKISSSIKYNKRLPLNIPFFLSNDQKDINYYKDELTALDIFPPPFKHLNHFPFIHRIHRENPTFVKAQDLIIQNKPQGSLVSFTLPKGAYATTLLSHFTNIISGEPSNLISHEHIESNELTTKIERINTLEYFKKINLVENNNQD